ncbi:hypothetical protein [Hyphococcus sp.]|uniref:hypothetical protein n=1 Tax=Hyphococcus sp. TaxID=2038636 RepID=UPI0035C6EAF6
MGDNQQSPETIVLDQRLDLGLPHKERLAAAPVHELSLKVMKIDLTCTTGETLTRLNHLFLCSFLGSTPFRAEFWAKRGP